jgi:hypothetical protein
MAGCLPSSAVLRGRAWPSSENVPSSLSCNRAPRCPFCPGLAIQVRLAWLRWSTYIEMGAQLSDLRKRLAARPYSADPRMLWVRCGYLVSFWDKRAVCHLQRAIPS